jgi:hypothetical protein
VAIENSIAPSGDWMITSPFRAVDGTAAAGAGENGNATVVTALFFILPFKVIESFFNRFNDIS